MKINLCVPGKTFSKKFLFCWSNLIKSLVSRGIEWDYIDGYHPNIYRVRERIAINSLNRNCDYMLWIDSDMAFEPNDLFKLLSHNENIVSGLYKQPDMDYCAFNLNGGIFKSDDFEEGKNLIEVKANGMGFMLIKKEVFENVPQPWFSTNSELISEDIYFQNKCKEYGYKSIVDTDIILGHEKMVVLK